jgi:hypothetical protein
MKIVEELPKTMENQTSDCLGILSAQASDIVKIGITEELIERISFEQKLENENQVHNGYKFTASQNKLDFYIFANFATIKDEQIVVNEISNDSFSRYCSIPSEYQVFSTELEVKIPKIAENWRDSDTQENQELYDDGENTFGFKGLGYGSHFKAGVMVKLVPWPSETISNNRFNFLWNFESIDVSKNINVPDSIAYQVISPEIDNCKSISLQLSSDPSFENGSMWIHKSSNICGERAAPFLNEIPDISSANSEPDILRQIEQLFPITNNIWKPEIDGVISRCNLRDDISNTGCYFPIVEDFERFLHPFILGEKDLFAKIVFANSLEAIIKIDKNASAPAIISSSLIEERG